MDVRRTERELVAERERLLAERTRLEGTLRESNADAADPVALEDSDELVEQALDHVLRQVDAALTRIAQGTYGSCERCGAPITSARLEALSYATMCVACAERAGR